jgi:hypothetical protein
MIVRLNHIFYGNMECDDLEGPLEHSVFVYKKACITGHHGAGGGVDG